MSQTNLLCLANMPGKGPAVKRWAARPKSGMKVFHCDYLIKTVGKVTVWTTWGHKLLNYARVEQRVPSEYESKGSSWGWTLGRSIQALGPGTRERISLPEGGDGEQWRSSLVGPADKQHLRAASPQPQTPAGSTDNPDGPVDRARRTLVWVWRERGDADASESRALLSPPVWMCMNGLVCVCGADLGHADHWRSER